MRATEATEEARRCLQICNACRYCEGYCAVFPAMELRRGFANGDLGYLANLCHDCRGCYYACQYAPPHEFGLNLPQTLARVRQATYREYAWPRPLAALFDRNGAVVSLVLSCSIAVVCLLTWTLQSSAVLRRVHGGSGSFYAVIPETVMVTVASATLLFALLALSVGFLKFWRATAGRTVVQPRAFFRALGDVLTLRNLGGGGHGCNDRDASFSQARRYAHHALFYGFLLCFASTCAAAVEEHVLRRISPYPFFSLPVFLGTAGGVGMMAGALGLLWRKSIANPAPAAKSLRGPDASLLVLLFLAAATGELLLAFRATAAMAALLALHLGVILSFFLILPYSKFVHGVYRFAALLHHAAERR